MTAEDEAKQLDSVTDRVQEAELDASRATSALSGLSGAGPSSSAGDNDAHTTVAVLKADVDAIVAELEVTEDEAAAALRGAAEAGNEGQALMVEALRRLVTS